jgi:CRISPR/Cas system-associated endonuclease Cas1
MTTGRHARSTTPEIVAPYLCSGTHPDRWRRSSLVYDLLEPLRPQVDRQPILMVRSRSFAAGDFSLHPSGLVRLNPKQVRYAVSEIRVGAEQTERVAGYVLKVLRNRNTQS